MAETTGTNTAADLTGGNQESGREIFRSFLKEYGLGALADDDALWNASKAKSQDEWWFDIKKTPTFRTRFKGIIDLQDRAAKGEYIPYIPSVEEYVSLEKGYTDKAKEYGIPTGFYDSPDDFAAFISGFVSVDEFDQRLKMAQQAALGSDPTFREELGRLVPGAGVGDLTAFFLDPDKGQEVLTTKFAQAQYGTAARRNNFGLLSLDEIETLQSKMTLEQAEQGFEMLDASREITGALPGEEEAGMSRQAQFQLVEGQGQAKEQLMRRQRRRTAAFEGGGGFAEGQQGVSGLGQGT